MSSCLQKYFLYTLLLFSPWLSIGQKVGSPAAKVLLPVAQKEESDAETVIIEAKKNVFAGKYDVAIQLLEK